MHHSQDCQSPDQPLGPSIEDKKTTTKRRPRFKFRPRQLGKSVLLILLNLAMLINSVSPALAATFTPGMAKRNAPGPFAGGVMVQGKSDQSVGDSLIFSTGLQINDKFFENRDFRQGSITFWITPEWSSNDGLAHQLFGEVNSLSLWSNGSNELVMRDSGAGGNIFSTAINWVAGQTYLVTARWDTVNTLDGTNHVSLSVNDQHSLAKISGWTPNSPPITFIGQSALFFKSANALIEGLTVYRRPLFDGQYGIDVGNGDEIAQIYNSGAGKDPTLVTGSWDVVFALPTNSSPGALTTGTGNAWSHPHSSNLLYSNTTNTGGFMMNGTPANDGWSEIPWYKVGGASGVVAAYQPIGAASLAASYTNLANPGTYNAAPGVAPTWDINNGWIFNGSTQYLTSGVQATGSHAALLRFSNASVNKLLFGTSGSTTRFFYQIAGAGGSYGYGNSVQNMGASDFISGVVGIAGNIAYQDGASVGNLTGTFSGTSGAMFLGALNNGGVPFGFYQGNIQAAAIYSQTLSPTQVANVTDAMEALDSDGSYLTTSALATNEKIFAGGYKYTSNGANQGISRSFTATSGGDYVLRALGHSDGTCSPQVKITRADGTTEISHLNGTTSSTRTDPDVYVFTWESPAAEENQVQLLNTATSGTCYWHQVEVLPNLVNNPSLETGSGDPWIPTGWANGGLDAGDSEMESTVVHSGQVSLQFNANANNSEFMYSSFTGISIDEYAMVGAFAHTAGTLKTEGGRSLLQSSSDIVNADQTNGSNWQHLGGAIRSIGSNNDHLWLVADSTEMFVDDAYAFKLPPVSLTVTPASQANSIENTDELRVDGRDTYVASSAEATSIGTNTGFVSFNYRPRHNAADAVKFAETTSADAYILSLYGDADDYVNVYWDSANTLRLSYSAGGVTGTGTWDATGSIAANTEYPVSLSYTGGGNMTLAVGGTNRISLSSIPASFGTAPNTVYFGSNSSGANQGDATFSSIVFDNIAPSISLTVLSPDPTSDTTPTLTGTATEAIGTVSNVEYQVDSTAGSWTACTADDSVFDEASEAFSCTSSTLSDGSHTIYVRSTDSNGNTTASGSESSDQFVIDATAPSSPGTPSTATPTNSTTQVWVWTAATDALSGVASYAWRVIDGALNTVASGTTSLLTATTNLTNGIYTFFVKAIDNAGNEGAESQSQVTVDTTIPSVSLYALSPNPTTDKTPTITGIATDTDGTISSVVFQMDSTAGNWTPCTAEDSNFDEQSEAFACTPSELPDGNHTIYVKSADNAYNISGIISSSFSIDTTAPQAVVISSPGGNQYLSSERPTFSFKPTSDISGIKNYKLIVDNPGDKDFSIDSIDPNRTDTFEASNYIINYENLSDSDPSNDLIKVTTKSSRDWGANNNDGKVLEGMVNWRVVAVDNAGNEGTSSSRFFVDRTNPNVNFTQINHVPLDSEYFATTDRTPTIFGKITDALAGPELSEGQEQSEDGPKVASGPKSVELNIEKQSSTGYSPYLIETLNLNTPWWTCGDTEITDNTKQKCDKYLPFEYILREEMELGTYKITIKGKDIADNASGETSFTLDITTVSQITTPEERQEIEEEISQLPEEEKPSSIEDVEITKPVEPTITRELADQGREVVDTAIDTTSNIVSSTLSAIGNGISSVIGFTVKTIGSMARAGYSAVAFVAKTTVNIASLAVRTTADLAGLIINQTTSALAFGFNQAGRAISWTFGSIGDGYNYLAGKAPGVAGRAMSSLGSGVSGITSALSSSFGAISEGTKQVAEAIGNEANNLFSGARNTVVAIGGGIQAVGRGTQSLFANVLFVVGERTQYVSEKAGFAMVKFGYNFVSEPTTISDVTVEILSANSTKITWQTNHPANGKVNYGLDRTYPFDVQTEKRTTHHEFVLTDLKPDTLYYFEVMSQNKNYVYDANREFKTPAE